MKKIFDVINIILLLSAMIYWALWVHKMPLNFVTEILLSIGPFAFVLIVIGYIYKKNKL